MTSITALSTNVAVLLPVTLVNTNASNKLNPSKYWIFCENNTISSSGTPVLNLPINPKFSRKYNLFS